MQATRNGEKIILKKIAQGYYEGVYRGVKFEIIKVEQINASTRNQWYWEIGGRGGEDWFRKKSIAIEAVTERIDEKIEAEKEPEKYKNNQ